MRVGGKRLSHTERKQAAGFARAPVEDLKDVERAIVKVFLAEHVARHVDGLAGAARKLLDFTRHEWECLNNKTRRSPEP